MREDFEQTLHARLAEEHAKALAQAKADLAIDHANLTAELTEKATQLEDSRTRELALLKQARMLEDEKAALDLELERRLQAERTTIEQTVETRLAEQHRLRDLEKDEQLGRALSGLAGMYGDMQGLVGASLPKVAHLELGSGDGQNVAEQPALPVMDHP